LRRDGEVHDDATNAELARIPSRNVLFTFGWMWQHLDPK
jgi:hypothetical protein